MSRRKQKSASLLAIAPRKTPEDRAELERQIASDPDLAHMAALQDHVWRALDSWEAPAVTEAFDRKLYARIQNLQEVPWYSRVFSAVGAALHRPALQLSVALIGVFAGIAVEQSHSRVNSVQPAGLSVSVSDAEQIENSLDDLQLLHQIYQEPSGSSSPRSM